MSRAPPPWRRRPSSSFGKSSGETRAALLRRIADLIQENTAALVARANLETGLPAARLQGRNRPHHRPAPLVCQGRRGRPLGGCPHRPRRSRPHAAPKPDVRSMFRPLGPVVVFSSSNFPFAFSVAGGDTASALAAGCPVIVKAHQGHFGHLGNDRHCSSNRPCKNKACRKEHSPCFSAPAA